MNQALGVVEFRDETALDQVQPSLEQAASAVEDRLFHDISDADLAKLGIDEKTTKIARLGLGQVEAWQMILTPEPRTT